MVFKGIALRKIWRCFNTIIRLQHCLHSNGGFWAKSTRNTGQDGQLKIICPEIFFDILTGGCIFNPKKVLLSLLNL